MWVRALIIFWTLKPCKIKNLQNSILVCDITWFSVYCDANPNLIFNLLCNNRQLYDIWKR